MGASERLGLSRSPEYLTKEIGRFWEEIHRQAIRVYDRRTVQPGAAMTVKEMGPAVGAFSPALFMLVRRKSCAGKRAARVSRPEDAISGRRQC